MVCDTSSTDSTLNLGVELYRTASRFARQSFNADGGTRRHPRRPEAGELRRGSGGRPPCPGGLVEQLHELNDGDGAVWLAEDLNGDPG